MFARRVIVRVIRGAPLAVSCVLHLAVVVGILTMGQLWRPRDLVAIEAQLLAPEPPPPVEPPRAKPEPPKREPRKPEVKKPEPPKNDPVVLPKPLIPPPREVASEPPPTPPPVETSPPSVPPRAPAGPERGPAGPATGPIAMTPSAETGPGLPASRSAAPTPVAPSVATKTPGDGPVRMAHPRGGYQVKPSYPPAARRLGIQGTTLLRVYVAADGQVTEVLVDESAGHPDMDRAAADAVRRWRFEPGRRGDQPVGMWVRLPVQFVLQ